MKILDLPLKKEWYNMIEAGIKKEEYREIKPYWRRRFYLPIDAIRFRYGYTKKTMVFKLKSLTVGKGNPEWGAPKDKEVFILKIGKRITIK